MFLCSCPKLSESLNPYGFNSGGHVINGPFILSLRKSNLMCFHRKRIRLPDLLLVVIVFILHSCTSRPDPYNGWQSVNGNSSGNKYSSLSQIDTNNVLQLKAAWTYHTGDLDTASHSQIQCNPIVVNGILYATSPKEALLRWMLLPVYKWTYQP
jgi:hypothetical protein